MGLKKGPVAENWVRKQRSEVGNEEHQKREWLEPLQGPQWPQHWHSFPGDAWWMPANSDPITSAGQPYAGKHPELWKEGWGCRVSFVSSLLFCVYSNCSVLNSLKMVKYILFFDYWKTQHIRDLWGCRPVASLSLQELPLSGCLCPPTASNDWGSLLVWGELWALPPPWRGRPGQI